MDFLKINDIKGISNSEIAKNIIQLEKKLFDPHRLLLIHVCQHQRNIRGQKVIHFVA